MSNEYGAIPLSTANAVGASLKKKMGSLTGYAPVDWAETINKLGNKLPERTVSGAVCSFSDGADDVPMPSVKASITAVQAGSGDPSPSNVRAISGFAECDVTHTKKNVWGGEKMADDAVAAVNNSSRVYKGSDTNGKYFAISAGNGLNVPWYTNFKENTRYTFILKASKSNNATSTNMLIRYTDGSTVAIAFPEAPVSGTVYTIVVKTAANKTVKHIQGQYNNGITYVYYEQSGLFEGVLTASDYESYAGETIPVWMGGKNRFINPATTQTIQTVVFTVNSDKSVTCNGTATAQADLYMYGTSSVYVDLGLPAGNYIINGGTANAKFLVVRHRDGQNTVFSNAGNDESMDIADGDTFRVMIRVQNGVQVSNVTVYPMIRPATESDNTYEPCRYIYGGELNLTTGVLTVTHLVDDLSNLNWTTRYTGSTNKTLSALLSSYYDVASPSYVAEQFKYVNAIRTVEVLSTPDDDVVGVYSFGSGTNRNNIYAVLPVSNTPSGKVIYKLQTPTTIQLTPEEVRSFLGTNNLWANTGDSEVTYFAQPSGGITPVFDEEVICDNSSASSTLTFTEDWHDYDFLQFKLTNSSSGIITYITTTPDILDEIFARSSSKVLFNEFSNDQYALYEKSSDLSWSRSGTRNVNVTEVKGLTATNCTVTTEWIYKRGAITASNVTITAPKYFEAYDDIYMASCDGDSDDTMPCILPVRAGCAGYNFYGNNGRNCVRLTGNTSSDTYGKDETKNIFAMMGINYEEV